MTKLTVTSINAPKKRRNGPMIKVGNGKGLFRGTELARDWRDQRNPQTKSERSRTKVRCDPGSAKVPGYFVFCSIEDSVVGWVEIC
jgi:hypothetical protein